ncbi:MAG: hypothetical protein J5I59_13345 [Saprospiraceae bacterium]|nr:hypothetical protein [Saprospiraceae bacterium]
MTNQELIKQFSPNLFWDCDPADLDFDRHKEQIILRVLGYGVMSDWRLVRKIYSLDTIRETCVKARYIDDVSLSFLCLLLDLKKSDFRCYTMKQSNPSYWES